METPVRWLSFSQIAGWIACRYRWHLRYEVGLRERIVNRPPALGSAIHVGTAAGMLGKSIVPAVDVWFKELIEGKGFSDLEIEGFREIKETGIAIATRTVNWLIDEEFEVLDDWVEKRIEYMPWPDSRLESRRRSGFMGILDLAAFHGPTNTLWVIDHKSRTAFLPIDSEEVNLQAPIYQKIAREAYGLEAVGTRTLEIKSSLPSIPKQNKNGTMSQQDILTDWTTYRAALVENGLDPMDYLGMQEKLLEKRFFQWNATYRSSEEVDAIWDQIVIPAAREIWRKPANRPKPVRCFQRITCQGCWARDYCLEELRGGDTEFLTKTMYTLKGGNDGQKAISSTT